MGENTDKYNIICLSNQLWTYPLWTNKRHVMTRLSKLGHSVLFIDPPINAGRIFFKDILKGLWGPVRLLTWVFRSGDVTVFTPIFFLPLRKLLTMFHIFQIKKIFNRVKIANRKTILWVYHVEIPFLKEYLGGIPSDLLIYDCVDNYPAFPRYDTPEKKKAIVEIEDYLATKADLIFASAPGLMDRLLGLNKNVHFTPNVGNYESFRDIKRYLDQIPADIQGIPRPRIGFEGAVDSYKFDSKLVLECAKAHPKYSFVIIGPMALNDSEVSKDDLGFRDVPNVYFLGTRPYETMPKYMAGFDAFIIPYQLNDYTVGGCFPVKFHEALAAGKPTIVTNLPAYAPFKEVCYISRSNQEFINNIKTALDEDSPLMSHQRELVAKQNTWEGKVSSLLSLINKTFKEVK